MNSEEFLKAKAKYRFGYDFEGKDVLKNHEKKYETLDKYRDLRMAYMDDMFVDFAFSITDDMLVLLDERNNEPIIYNHGNYAIVVDRYERYDNTIGAHIFHDGRCAKFCSAYLTQDTPSTAGILHQRTGHFETITEPLNGHRSCWNSDCYDELLNPDIYVDTFADVLYGFAKEYNLENVETFIKYENMLADITDQFMNDRTIDPRAKLKALYFSDDVDNIPIQAMKLTAGVQDSYSLPYKR